MNRAERTVQILLSAFFKGKLKHGKECECAVGHLVCGGSMWTCCVLEDVMMCASSDQIFAGNQEIRQTGYSTRELFFVEAAFEGRKKSNGYKGFSLHLLNDPDSFLGLSAVFDVLLKIDKDYFQSRPAFRITNEVEVLEPA